VLFDPAQREKLEKFGIFRGNFPNPNHKWLTQPEPQKIDPTKPGSKTFGLDPSLSLYYIILNKL